MDNVSFSVIRETSGLAVDDRMKLIIKASDMGWNSKAVISEEQNLLPSFRNVEININQVS